MILSLVIIAALAYLIGSFPTALLLVRRLHKKDVRQEGTGNIGARNAYDITGSHSLAIVIGLIDAGKGALSVLLVHWLFDGWFAGVAVAAFASVLSHNWNPWLRGKGGRGLATAAGAFLAISPLFVLVWFVMFATGYYAIRKHVHVGSMSAIIGSAVLAWSIPDLVIAKSSFVVWPSPTYMRILVAAVSILLFIRHLEPLRSLIRDEQLLKDEDDE